MSCSRRFCLRQKKTSCKIFVSALLGVFELSHCRQSSFYVAFYIFTLLYIIILFCTVFFSCAPLLHARLQLSFSSLQKSLLVQSCFEFDHAFRC